MTASQIVLRPQFGRRLPDPVHPNVQHYIFWIPAHTLVDGLSYGPNARRPNTRKDVYKRVDESLRNIDCTHDTFHLKNLGIVINAERVTRHAEDNYTIDLPDPELHGVLNGGHTLDLIVNRVKDGTIPTTQFVKVEVRTGVPEAWLPEIAGGLNTGMQVEDMSLQDLAGAFEWIKAELKDETYFPKIAWSENDAGDYDARDIVSLMICFHIGYFPNGQAAHPYEAYEKKSKVLDEFRRDFELHDGEEFQRVRPILRDILVLHDILQSQFGTVHNTKNKGKAGHLKIMDVKAENSRTKFTFPFISKTGTQRVQTGVLYPLLASFRWMVEVDASGSYRWKGGFAAVKKRWEEVGPELVRKSVERAKELGNNSNAVGKSRSHWESLYQSVAFADLMATAQKR